MKTTFQTAQQSVLQHGLAVYKHTYQLLHNPHSDNFRLPPWWDEYADELLKNCCDLKTIKHYTIWHDLGKPQCRTVDERGAHFPDHARVSAQLWDTHQPNRPEIGRLIAHDMLFHTASAEEILSHPLSDWELATLLLVSLAELHANAQLFGGIHSDGFKIKWKKWSKTAHKICQKRFDHSYIYVLVRNDLSQRQKAVQSSHACIEAARAYLTPGDKHPSVIICSVKSEHKLKLCAEELSAKGIPTQIFREPDIGHQMTALASAPMRGAQRKIFSRFQLMQ